MQHEKQILLVALGGNALIRKGQAGTIAEQFENLKLPIRQIAKLSQQYKIIITHGNGPQVGNLLLQQESCNRVPELPLEILVAQTQGQIGYMIETTLDSELMQLGEDTKKLFVSLLSYVVVDENDPAFQAPSKPVGPASADGYRRLVASPQPITIVEKREIRKLIEMDFIVICCGGGGIPVIREDRSFSGVDAVIDKDLASAKLAEEIGVDVFLIATDTDGVALNFGTPQQQFLRSLSLTEAAHFLDADQFPSVSMGPKVQAAMQFRQATGRRAVITSIGAIQAAVDGNEGTEIVKEKGSASI